MSDEPVLYVCKGDIDLLPPCLTQVLALASAGSRVTLVVGGAGSTTRRLLAAAGVEVVVTGTSGRGAAAGWIGFRRRVGEILREPGRRETLVWVGSGDTALALNTMLSGRRYVLTLLELYDTVPHYRVALGPLARGARVVVVPEETRGPLMRLWWRLPQTPVVLPNKPFVHPRLPRQPAVDHAQRGLLSDLRRYKVVLYQGLIAGGERDLRPLAEAMSGLGGTHRLVVMGRDDHQLVPDLTARCPGLVHIDHVRPPEHLVVTSHAWLGIANYQPWNLNTMFCAPNKIYEYAGFGVPTLGNRVPGLLNTLERHGAGLCVDLADPAEVLRAIADVEQLYETLASGATAMFEQIDIEGIVQGVLKRARVSG